MYVLNILFLIILGIGINTWLDLLARIIVVILGFTKSNVTCKKKFFYTLQVVQRGQIEQ